MEKHESSPFESFVNSMLIIQPSESIDIFQILNRCREYSNFNGAIDFNCRWIAEQPNRACCYIKPKGAQFSDYNFSEDYCSLNVLCRYCENPPSQYLTTTTTLAPAPTFGWGWEGCFPSTAKVTIQNGKTMTMSELQTGDHVQTG